MTALAVVRGLALIGAALVGWSLNLRWGAAGSGVGAGPPLQWERQVVAALLAAGVVLVVVAFAARRGRPTLGARVAALLAGLGAAVVPVVLWRDAAGGFTGLVDGPGWSTLAAGAGLVLLAAIGFLGVSRVAPAASVPPGGRGPRRRGRPR